MESHPNYIITNTELETKMFCAWNYLPVIIPFAQENKEKPEWFEKGTSVLLSNPGAQKD